MLIEPEADGTKKSNTKTERKWTGLILGSEGGKEDMFPTKLLSHTYELLTVLTSFKQFWECLEKRNLKMKEYVENCQATDNTFNGNL